MLSEPDLRSYKLDMTSIKSEVFLTGKKRERGTLMPIAFWKFLMAAPEAVSNWITFVPIIRDEFMVKFYWWLPFDKVFSLTIISISSICPLLQRRSTASTRSHRLLVLKILNLETDLNSSTCSFGTWAISRRRARPSYSIKVPPYFIWIIFPSGPIIFYLDISTGLVSNFHTVLGFWVLSHVCQNVQVDGGAQVVNIWQENLL